MVKTVVTNGRLTGDNNDTQTCCGGSSFTWQVTTQLCCLHCRCRDVSRILPVPVFRSKLCFQIQKNFVVGKKSQVRNLSANMLGLARSTVDSSCCFSAFPISPTGKACSVALAQTCQALSLSLGRLPSNVWKAN